MTIRPAPSLALPPLLLAALFLVAAPSHASIKCWTNKDGVRECADRIPPEYASQETELMNRRGIVTGVREGARTPAELEREAREAREREERQRHQEQQAAYDRVLLSTFLTEQDLERSRERNLAAIDGTILVTENNTQKMRETLAGLERRQAALEQRGSEVPEQVAQDIAQLQRQIAANEEFVRAKRAEREELNGRFDRDLHRFRELKADR